MGRKNGIAAYYDYAEFFRDYKIPKLHPLMNMIFEGNNEFCENLEKDLKISVKYGKYD